ncbi:MAG TPA: hypothetical protein VGN97_21815 [Mesorhizobium sp.]|jgi:hypothetical protein|nr:hypothetical protein [Mesorhizobium sp.]
MNERRLYLAHISEPGEGLPNATLNMLYVILAPSEAVARAAIKSARGKQCAIEFRPHTLPEAEIIERLGLRDGVARPLN